MSFFSTLVEECLQDDYFLELISKAEIINANNFFSLQHESLTEKEYIDLLRFADILSRSDNSEALNKSYKVVSILAETYSDNQVFLNFAKSILIKMGNFPAIKFLEDNYNIDCGLPVETFINQTIKEDYQKIPNSELTFTDSQYEIFEKLKNSNHFSFSGPTSLGKSFVINSFIRHLISEHKGTDNIAILVPTRALINQTVNQLKKEFSDVANYKVLAYPKVPKTFKTEESRFIFVFTPERLLSYLSNLDNPKLDYLFVDEAHKIISQKDSRSPLYYHAILQAEKKSVKLYFASPNIPNPEVFLSIFEKSTDEKLNIKNSPVSQNRFFMDFIENNCLYFSDQNEDIKIPINLEGTEFFHWLTKLSNNDKSIVYCNSKKDTIDLALSFSQKLPLKSNPDIDELISIIKENLHEDYFLIDCLKKGVAFHFGNLPQDIRERVENLFAMEGGINFLFCTSTLLEGVNLPAKNIFILSNAIGLSKFTDIDFWNLAGRAGRMTKELSGNIICARIEDKQNRWDNPNKDLNVAKIKTTKPIESILVSGRGNFYTNLERALKEEQFTNKAASVDQKSIWNHYSNIAQIHEIYGYDSTLRTSFIEKVTSAKDTLKKGASINIVPEKILSYSSMIKPKYQNSILSDTPVTDLFSFGVDTSYSSCLEALEHLYTLYNWQVEESAGHNAMCRTVDVLKYYAVILSSWMSSTPLNLMVKNSLKHYEEKGVIWDDTIRQEVNFSRSNKSHVNIVINNLMYDIDNILRFKLKNYFDNYYLLLRERVGEKGSGTNWAEFLEYGTSDHRMIELQNVGFSRHLASMLLEKFSEYLTFEDDDLLHIDADIIALQLNDSPTELQEFKEVLSI
ncbi:DEAD/DEAH box helicase [Vibrio alginolyticus]|nr:DEAD/DEAH box helicase [Vibrio alginolyticus]